MGSYKIPAPGKPNIVLATSHENNFSGFICPVLLGKVTFGQTSSSNEVYKIVSDGNILYMPYRETAKAKLNNLWRSVKALKVISYKTTDLSSALKSRVDSLHNLQD